jgi:xylan 1,4-beta-xylosidase
MVSSILRPLVAVFTGSYAAVSALPLFAQSGGNAPRSIVVDIQAPKEPVDRFFGLPVGSDYPGTLIRDDSHARLKVAVEELGFRHIRFHAIFHDVLSTLRIENGKTVYN